MLWKLNGRIETQGVNGQHEGKRFVLQRHMDAHGPHLDLRLEQDGYLVGFRIDGLEIDGEVWATEKGPHPIDWLDRDGDTVREDAGTYVLERTNRGEVNLTLNGEKNMYSICATQEPGLPPRVIREIDGMLRAHGANASDAAQMIADGFAARRRAMGRLCGLARELDGVAFDEDVCRRALAGLNLEEIHTQLRAYEVRFDAKFPPAPVSQPESLPERASHTATALAILRGDNGA